MTVQEFKEKYPDKAHLEGDALWNAMEDDFLQKAEPINARCEVKDWKGNVVKADDTICFIRTKPMFSSACFVMFDPSKETFEMGEEIKAPEHCWDVSEYKVVDRNGILYYNIEGKGETTYSFQLAGFAFWLQPDEIIAIKGVSDNEQEYLQSIDHA